jgi:hypothetical protein
MRRLRIVLAAAFALAGAPRVAGAQGVLLEIRPRPGDTLRTRLDHQVEQRGTMRVDGSDSTRTVLTNLVVLGRTIVIRGDVRGTTVIAFTDSVAMSTSGGEGAAFPEEVRKSLQGTRVEMRISPDGAMSMVSGTLGTDLQALVEQIPATLPKRAVKVGQSWTKTMPIPLPGEEDGAGARVRATFRLDSLSSEGRLAYISMRGEFSRDTASSARSAGVKVDMSGTLSGNLQVDRHRGWMTDSRVTITVNSLLTPPEGNSSEPLRYRMKITQRSRTLDNR